MSGRHKDVSKKVIVGLLVPIISLCITFIILYTFMPQTVARKEPKLESIAITSNSPAMQEAAAEPKSLSIGSINVDAIIKPVGLTSSGDMDIDDNPGELAWYKLGPKPGEKGSAVIAGHYGWKNNVPSIFNDLSDLIKGDEITVSTEDGKQKKFVVTKTEKYNPDQDATDVFRSSDGKAHLNLITCSGSWVTSEQTYTKRLVVFTDYVE